MTLIDRTAADPHDTPSHGDRAVLLRVLTGLECFADTAAGEAEGAYAQLLGAIDVVLARAAPASAPRATRGQRLGDVLCARLGVAPPRREARACEPLPALERDRIAAHFRRQTPLLLDAADRGLPGAGELAARLDSLLDAVSPCSIKDLRRWAVALHALMDQLACPATPLGDETAAERHGRLTDFRYREAS